MQITVFGASGAIGQLLVKKALEEGFCVIAYVRSPGKILFSHQNLIVVKGVLNNFQIVREAISGTDAVISTMGPPLVKHYEGRPVLDGHKNIIMAMQFEKVSRLITLATPCVKSSYDRKSIATIVPGIAARFLFPDSFNEIIRIGKAVSSSGLDWTIVRIIAPNNTPASGSIAVSFGDKRIHWSISRADIAAFMLNQVRDKQYIHSMPIIGS